MKNFYENKLVDRNGIIYAARRIVADDGEEVRDTNLTKTRKDVLTRSVLYFVDNFDESFAFSLLWNIEELIARLFPRISRYVENEETRSKFVDFMTRLVESNDWLFAYVFFYSEDRDVLISLMEATIRNNEECMIRLIQTYLEKDGKPFFDCLKNRGLLDWSKFEQIDELYVEHIDGMKWIEPNGIDVVNSKEHFERYARYASKEVKEYLASRGGKMIEYLISENDIHSDDLEIIYKFKGLKAIESIDVEKISFGFEEVKFLKSIGYKFDGEKILFTTRELDEYYALLCFNVLKYEDLIEKATRAFERYVSNNDIKACKQMYPFMKEIRKKKIMTVLLCMKKIPLSYPLPKEIIWNIDYAYPIQERGSL